MSEPIAEAHDLKRHYRTGGRVLRAVDGVSFSIAKGTTLAVVGESGSGKSTLGRMVALIEKPDAGGLLIGGIDALAKRNAEERRLLRRSVQMVFQNPYGSLNPRARIGAALAEPLEINTDLGRAEIAERVRAMLIRVGLVPEHARRYPHMFSGGQRQRIAIARALMLHPALIVADEPVSALDASVQAQILNLLGDLQAELGLSYLFISHDLGVVRHVADALLVLYLGRSVEAGPAETIFTAPRHPYTRALIAASGGGGPALLRGELPSPLDVPEGCAFRTRCPFAVDRCRAETPLLRPVDGRMVACHEAENLPCPLPLAGEGGARVAGG